MVVSGCCRSRLPKSGLKLAIMNRWRLAVCFILFLNSAKFVCCTSSKQDMIKTSQDDKVNRQTASLAAITATTTTTTPATMASAHDSRRKLSAVSLELQHRALVELQLPGQVAGAGETSDQPFAWPTRQHRTLVRRRIRRHRQRAGQQQQDLQLQQEQHLQPGESGGQPMTIKSRFMSRNDIESGSSSANETADSLSWLGKNENVVATSEGKQQQSPENWPAIGGVGSGVGNLETGYNNLRPALNNTSRGNRNSDSNSIIGNRLHQAADYLEQPDEQFSSASSTGGESWSPSSSTERTSAKEIKVLSGGQDGVQDGNDDDKKEASSPENGVGDDDDYLVGSHDFLHFANSSKASHSFQPVQHPEVLHDAQVKLKKQTNHWANEPSWSQLAPSSSWLSNRNLNASLEAEAKLRATVQELHFNKSLSLVGRNQMNRSADWLSLSNQPASSSSQLEVEDRVSLLPASSAVWPTAELDPASHNMILSSDPPIGGDLVEAANERLSSLRSSHRRKLQQPWGQRQQPEQTGGESEPANWTPAVAPRRPPADANDQLDQLIYKKSSSSPKAFEQTQEQLQLAKWSAGSQQPGTQQRRWKHTKSATGVTGQQQPNWTSNEIQPALNERQQQVPDIVVGQPSSSLQSDQQQHSYVNLLSAAHKSSRSPVGSSSDTDSAEPTRFRQTNTRQTYKFGAAVDSSSSPPIIKTFRMASEADERALALSSGGRPVESSIFFGESAPSPFAGRSFAASQSAARYSVPAQLETASLEPMSATEMRRQREPANISLTASTLPYLRSSRNAVDFFSVYSSQQEQQSALTTTRAPPPVHQLLRWPDQESVQSGSQANWTTRKQTGSFELMPKQASATSASLTLESSQQLPLTLNLSTHTLVGPNQLFWEAVARESALQSVGPVPAGRLAPTNAHAPLDRIQFGELSAASQSEYSSTPIIMSRRPIAVASLTEGSHTNGHAYPAASALKTPQMAAAAAAAIMDSVALDNFRQFAQLQSPELDYFSSHGIEIGGLDNGLGPAAAHTMLSSVYAPPPLSPSLPLNQSEPPLATPATMADTFGWPANFGSDAAKRLMQLNRVVPLHLMQVADSQPQSSWQTTSGETLQAKSEPTTRRPTNVMQLELALRAPTTTSSRAPSLPRRLFKRLRIFNRRQTNQRSSNRKENDHGGRIRRKRGILASVTNIMARRRPSAKSQSAGESRVPPVREHATKLALIDIQGDPMLEAASGSSGRSAVISLIDDGRLLSDSLESELVAQALDYHQKSAAKVERPSFSANQADSSFPFQLTDSASSNSPLSSSVFELPFEPVAPFIGPPANEPPKKAAAMEHRNRLKQLSVWTGLKPVSKLIQRAKPTQKPAAQNISVHSLPSDMFSSLALQAAAASQIHPFAAISHSNIGLNHMSHFAPIQSTQNSGQSWIRDLSQARAAAFRPATVQVAQPSYHPQTSAAPTRLVVPIPTRSISVLTSTTIPTHQPVSSTWAPISLNQSSAATQLRRALVEQIEPGRMLARSSSTPSSLWPMSQWSLLQRSSIGLGSKQSNVGHQQQVATMYQRVQPGHMFGVGSPIQRQTNLTDFTDMSEMVQHNSLTEEAASQSQSTLSAGSFNSENQFKANQHQDGADPLASQTMSLDDMQQQQQQLYQQQMFNMMQTGPMFSPLGMQTGVSIGRPRLPKLLPSINSMANKFRQHLVQTFRPLTGTVRWPLYIGSSNYIQKQQPVFQSLAYPIQASPPNQQQQHQMLLQTQARGRFGNELEAGGDGQLRLAHMRTNNLQQSYPAKMSANSQQQVVSSPNSQSYMFSQHQKQPQHHHQNQHPQLDQPTPVSSHQLSQDDSSIVSMEQSDGAQQQQQPMMFGEAKQGSSLSGEVDSSSMLSPQPNHLSDSSSFKTNENSSFEEVVPNQAEMLEQQELMEQPHSNFSIQTINNGNSLEPMSNSSQISEYYQPMGAVGDEEPTLAKQKPVGSVLGQNSHSTNNHMIQAPDGSAYIHASDEESPDLNGLRHESPPQMGGVGNEAQLVEQVGVPNEEPPTPHVELAHKPRTKTPIDMVNMVPETTDGNMTFHHHHVIATPSRVEVGTFQEANTESDSAASTSGGIDGQLEPQVEVQMVQNEMVQMVSAATGTASASGLGLGPGQQMELVRAPTHEHGGEQIVAQFEPARGQQMPLRQTKTKSRFFPGSRQQMVRLTRPHGGSTPMPPHESSRWHHKPLYHPQPSSEQMQIPLEQSVDYQATKAPPSVSSDLTGPPSMMVQMPNGDLVPSYNQPPESIEPSSDTDPGSETNSTGVQAAMYDTDEGRAVMMVPSGMEPSKHQTADEQMNHILAPPDRNQTQQMEPAESTTSNEHEQRRAYLAVDQPVVLTSSKQINGEQVEAAPHFEHKPVVYVSAKPHRVYQAQAGVARPKKAPANQPPTKQQQLQQHEHQPTTTKLQSTSGARHLQAVKTGELNPLVGGERASEQSSVYVNRTTSSTAQPTSTSTTVNPGERQQSQISRVTAKEVSTKGKDASKQQHLAMGPKARVRWQGVGATKLVNSNRTEQQQQQQPAELSSSETSRNEWAWLVNEMTHKSFASGQPTPASSNHITASKNSSQTSPLPAANHRPNAEPAATIALDNSNTTQLVAPNSSTTPVPLKSTSSTADIELSKSLLTSSTSPRPSLRDEPRASFRQFRHRTTRLPSSTAPLNHRPVASESRTAPTSFRLSGSQTVAALTPPTDLNSAGSEIASTTMALDEHSSTLLVSDSRELERAGVAWRRQATPTTTTTTSTESLNPTSSLATTSSSMTPAELVMASKHAGDLRRR